MIWAQSPKTNHTSHQIWGREGVLSGKVIRLMWIVRDLGGRTSMIQFKIRLAAAPSINIKQSVTRTEITNWRRFRIGICSWTRGRKTTHKGLGINLTSSKIMTTHDSRTINKNPLRSRTNIAQCSRAPAMARGSRCAYLKDLDQAFIAGGSSSRARIELWGGRRGWAWSRSCRSFRLFCLPNPKK